MVMQGVFKKKRLGNFTEEYRNVFSGITHISSLRTL